MGLARRKPWSHVDHSQITRDLIFSLLKEIKSARDEAMRAPVEAGSSGTSNKASSGPSRPTSPGKLGSPNKLGSPRQLGSPTKVASPGQPGSPASRLGSPGSAASSGASSTVPIVNTRGSTGTVLYLTTFREELAQVASELKAALAYAPGCCKLVLACPLNRSLYMADPKDEVLHQKLVEDEAAAVTAILRVGLTEQREVLCGAIGPVVLPVTASGTDLKTWELALRAAISAASQFEPRGPAIVILMSSDASVNDKAWEMVKKGVMQNRTILLNSRRPVWDGARRFWSEKVGLKEAFKAELWRRNLPCQYIPLEPQPIDVEERPLSELMPLPSEGFFVPPGLLYRSDFPDFGGDGFTLRRSLIPQPPTRSLCKFLDFDWSAELKDHAPKETFICDWCKERTVIDANHEPYTKFEFTYCSMTCLSAHRKSKMLRSEKA